MTSPASLPTGTLTFLFTDIEGSTQRWERQRGAMAAALVRHDELLRSAIESHGGHVFKTVGDAFYAAFGETTAALEAAIDAQRSLAAVDWAVFGRTSLEAETFEPLRVRMGIHHGQADARGGDYFGPELNRVARLMSAGHGGQVLLSLAAQQVVRNFLPEGVRLRDLGEHRLKDLLHPERLFQVLAPDLADVDITPRTVERLRAQDRIVVGEAAAPARELPESLAALLAAVRSDEATVALNPEQAREIAQRRPADLTEYRLGRIAEWSQPRYRLDGRFVPLTLLVDQGEESASGRWAAKVTRSEGLEGLLAELPDPALVVLGPPGSGKSTLLRHLELDTAIASLHGSAPAPAASPMDQASAGTNAVTFFVQLNQYKPEQPGGSVAGPGEWLAGRWALAYPDLPGLESLLGEGRMILLLDALNEMPATSERAFREQVGLWKDWLVRLVQTQPGNRVVFSCRTLDYSASLSTPALRVPQVQIEALSDEQVHEFLRLYSPVRGEDIWRAIVGTAQLEALRSPFFLALLVDQVEATGELAADRAGLFTGFVRQALRREVEQDNPLFALSELLADRDLRRLAQSSWQGPYDLPERGALVPKLGELAHGMQTRVADGEASQVRVDYDTALDLVDHPEDERIVKAGLALSVLDEDLAADEVLYRHQLLQEYFAARVLAREPRPELVRAPWRAADIRPGVPELLEALPFAEALPALPTTGWEETTILAAAMAADAEAFVRGIMATNLVLAARSATVPVVRGRLSEALLAELRGALAERSRDPAADLRARIVAGQVLGQLGDPRFGRLEGPHGAYLLPPMVSLPAGAYPMGDDRPIFYDYIGESGEEAGHVPAHTVRLSAFDIGRFAVTNAEWALFMAAGGYDDDRWWPTEDARRWRRGELPNEAALYNNRMWRRRFQADPQLLDRMLAEGRFTTTELEERWQRWTALDDEAFEAAIAGQWPPTRETAPRQWREERFNQPAQPVVGISFYEALAYCTWLSAQTGDTYRLPTEAEREAAARGPGGRRFAYGDSYEALRANTNDLHLKRPSPVGVFVEGDTPEGVSDLAGNTNDRTSSRWGTEEDETRFPYPYDAADGREDLAAPASSWRVVRGGSWFEDRAPGHAVFRGRNLPGDRFDDSGLRLVRERPSEGV